MEQSRIVRTIFIVYVAIVSLIGLVMMVIASSSLINMGLKTWVFPAADVPSWLTNCADPSYYDRTPVAVGETPKTEEQLRQDCETRRAQEVENYQIEKARDAVQNLAMLLVAIPLFITHERLFRRERKGAPESKRKN